MVCNWNGYTIAHWVASEGHIPIYLYLAEVGGVEFEAVVNDTGKSLLDHAVVCGNVNVVKWLMRQMRDQGCGAIWDGVVGSGSNFSSSRTYDIALDLVEPQNKNCFILFAITVREFRHEICFLNNIDYYRTHSIIILVFFFT